MSHDEAQREEFLGRLTEEFLRLCRRGEQPSIDQFAARWPEDAAEIRGLLSALVAMEGAAQHSDRIIPDEVAPQTPAHLRQLGDFRIRREIGRGGMGVVYEAEQVSLGRTVALKVLPRMALLDQRRLSRFRNEAQAAARLQHSNIVPVHAVGADGGVHYYAMRYIEGQTLRTAMRDLQSHDRRSDVPARQSMIADPVDPTDQRHTEFSAEKSGTTSPRTAASNGPGMAAEKLTGNSDSRHRLWPHAEESLPWSVRNVAYARKVAAIAAVVAETLDYAHQEGVVHRDIKPSNLILDQQGQIWVTDFGLTRYEASASVTATGDLVGTLRYMSPEQALGQRGQVDRRADIYSLGATLYELLTLTPAFPGENRIDVLRKIEWQDPAPPRKLNAAVPIDLETIVFKAMAKEPSERYATALELAEDLRRFLEGRPITARRPSLISRTSKLIARHRAVAGLAMAFLAASVVILAIADLQILRQRDRARKAATAAKVAQRESELSAARLWTERGTRRLNEGDFAGLLDLAQAARYAEHIPELKQPLSALWSLWHQSYEGRLLQLVDHGGAVHDIAFSPDGKLFATASADGTARLWDASTGQPRSPPLHHGAEVWTVVFHPDGKLLATGAADSTARLWNTTDYRPTLPRLPHPSGVVRRIAFSPDGKLIATSTVRGRQTRIWDVETGHLQVPPISHARHRCDLSFSPDGSLLAVASDGETTCLWDLATGTANPPLMHPNSVRSIQFSPDGDVLATAAYDRRIRLWNVAKGRRMSSVRADGLLLGVAFSPDGRMLGSATIDGSVQLWNARTPATENKSLLHEGGINAFQFSPDSRFIATAGKDHTARLWRVKDGQPASPSLRHADSVLSVAFSPDGSRLATCSSDGTARIWSTAGRRSPETIPQPGLVRAAEYSSNGSLLAVACGPSVRSAIPNRQRCCGRWNTKAPSSLWRFIPIAPSS